MRDLWPVDRGPEPKTQPPSGRLNSLHSLATRFIRQFRNRSVNPPANGILFWAVFAAASLLTASSLERSSYFLHWDVASQHMAALDFLKGCWGYDAGKPLIMFVLALTYSMFGAMPALESALLVLAAGLAAASLFQLARVALPGRGWALAATLWFLAWPTTLYYTRIHLGYGLALFLSGLAAATRGRKFISGVLLALGILAHPGLALPALVWLFVSTVLSQKRSVKNAILPVAGLALTLLLLESLRYLYTGEMFGWWQGQITDLRAYSSTGSDTRWSHVLEAFLIANGGMHTTVCVIGVTAFLVTVRRNRLSPGAPIFVTGIAVFTLYALRTGTGMAGFNTRLLLGANPLLAITAIAGLARTISPWRWTQLLPARTLFAALLLAAMLSGLADAWRVSRTAYPELEQAFLQAKSMSVPVRYFGQPYAALFFGVKHNVETLANATDFEVAPLHMPPAVIAVEASSPEEKHQVAQAIATIDSIEYDYRTYEHPVLSNQLRHIEEAFFPSTDQLWHLVRSPLPETAELVVWFPRNSVPVPPSSYADADQVPYEWLSYYYHGDGDCQIVPRDHPYAWRYHRYLLPRLRNLLN